VFLTSGFPFVAIIGRMLADVHPLSLEALLQAFAAIGTIVGGLSAYAGFLSLCNDDAPSEIGEAMSVGAAIAFPPGVFIACLVYIEVAGAR
jgi:hypothetical protein